MTPKDKRRGKPYDTYLDCPKLRSCPLKSFISPCNWKSFYLEQGRKHLVDLQESGRNFSVFEAGRK